MLGNPNGDFRGMSPTAPLNLQDPLPCCHRGKIDPGARIEVVSGRFDR